MLPRFSHIFSLAVCAALIIAGCKNAPNDPNNNNNNTTHINIGDTVPAKGSTYIYNRSQLDINGNIIPTTTSPGVSAQVDTVLQSVLGKNNVYHVNDDGDSAFFSYETNSDVSMYLAKPGFLYNYSSFYTDETLEAVVNAVFHNWITLPIATKGTITLADQSPSFTINGQQVKDTIHTIIEYIDSSTIVVKDTKELLPARHCRITITAQLNFARDHEVLKHVRDIWFVPKIGYIAQQIVRTDMPAVPVYVVPRDTTATLKVLTSYKFY